MLKRTVVVFLICSCFALLGVAPAGAQTLPTKQIAAPPSDILSGIVRRPEPMTLGVSSSAAMHPIDLTEGADSVWRASVEFFVSDAATARLMVVSPNAADWSTRVRFADGQSIALSDAGVLDARVKRHHGSYGIEGVVEPATMFEVAGERKDAWTLEVSAARGDAGDVDGYLLVASDDPVAVYAAYDGTLRVGEPVMIYASLYDGAAGAHRPGDREPTPVGATLERSSIEVRSPLARVEWADLDQAAPGIAESWTTVTFDEPGVHRVRVLLDGRMPDGRRVQRTATLLIPIVAHRAAIESVSAGVEGESVSFEIQLAGARLPGHFLAAAEVWGVGPEGPAPAAWIGGMVTPEWDQEAAGRATVRLGMHGDWASLAGIEPPYTLRNVRLEDADHHVAFAVADAVIVQGEDEWPRRAVEAITPEMLTGRMDAARSVPIPATNQASSIESGVTLDVSAHNIMLVHGYCAGGVPWPLAQFSPPRSVFGDFNQSRSNDQFAQLIGALGTLGKSFGVVGHSQGGLASLHLYTFYWSGLDWARGPRLIQSVGSPYQGTPLAGDLAVLGDIFGAGCGENTDLTYAGAAAWLSSIPTWARQRVYYHTTSFLDEPFTYDYCNFLSDFFLSDPEDGVVERSAGQLPGGNNMGHKEGWCHTTGMQDPAQYLDSARNADMNANAAR